MYFQGRCLASFTGSVSGDAGNHQVPRAPSHAQSVTSRAVAACCHVRGRYPAVIATTDSCVSPQSSRCLWTKPWSAGLCRLRSAPAGLRTFPALLHESFPRCLDPYPGGPHGALTRLFPQGIGLPRFLTGSALHTIPNNDFSPGIDYEAAAIDSCSGLRVCPPPRSFPPQRSLLVRAPCRRCRVRWVTQRFRAGPQSDSLGNDSIPLPLHWAAVAFTSTHIAVRYLAEQWIC